MDLTCTGWVFVEAAVAPCANELESKGLMINMMGVDGLIPKHWSTFKVHAALSKQERLRHPTITADRRFRGRYQIVTGVKGVDLPDT